MGSRSYSNLPKTQIHLDRLMSVALFSPIDNESPLKSFVPRKALRTRYAGLRSHLFSFSGCAAYTLARAAIIRHHKNEDRHSRDRVHEPAEHASNDVE